MQLATSCCVCLCWRNLEVWPCLCSSSLLKGGVALSCSCFFVGETWHYAWLATRLAQMGFVVLVHTYTLYPDALIPQVCGVSVWVCWLRCLCLDKRGKLPQRWCWYKLAQAL